MSQLDKTILVRPAHVDMLGYWDFLDHDIAAEIDPDIVWNIRKWQIVAGKALAFVIPCWEYDDELNLALAGLVPGNDKDHAEVWFYPGIDMPRHARALIKILPLHIAALMYIMRRSRATTVIDKKRKDFKKFAKLVKFEYSHDRVIEDISFEEWEFKG